MARLASLAPLPVLVTVLDNSTGVWPDVKRVCGLCHHERPVEKMQEGRALCADRRACQARAIGAIASGTPAQAEALRLAGKR